ncbi:ClpP/crotonase [Microthyrium microscopicum]|uniref:ClpP/crotonase n=1 Tax=Microthyrium microscopicum TaxID=703497 RepID=A0A6A6UKY2_9PEZI|nr:ClpP/crotonase [Microthyrium microscopicum]
MHLLLLLSSFCAIIQAVAVSTCDTNFIVTTKVTPSYWRATFSCPPLNIQGLSFFQDYYALIDKIEADSEVKVVVFDSSAPDFWLDPFDVLNTVPPELSWDSYWGNVTRLANLPVLTVAAIRGITSGGGAEIAASLDIRFGSKEKAIVSQPEVSIGVVPGGGGLDLLPRLVGRARALEMVIGSDDMDAETAAHYGWLNRAIPDAQFESFVDKFARRVAGWDHEGIAAAKKIINAQSGFPTVNEWKEGFTAFATNFNRTVVQNRVAAFKKAGLQTDLDFEKNMSEIVLNYTGPGPWNV